MTLLRYSIIFLFLVSCNTDRSPVTFYTQEELVPVMVDLYVASAALKDIDDNYKDSLTSLYRGQIAELHEVNMTKIDMDIALLQKYPKIYSALHAIVSDSIVQKEKRFSSSSNKSNKNRK